MIFLLIAGLAGVAALTLLIPLFRARTVTEDRRAAALSVYRGQLAEIETGAHLDEGERDAARREAERRLIRADGIEAALLAPRWPAPLAAALIVMALAGGLALYFSHGKPGQPDSPAHRPDAANAAENRQLARILPVLEGKLKDRPNDETGWILYARALSSLGRHAEALSAWTHLEERAPNNANYRVGAAQALILAAGGMSPAADLALREAARLDPENPAPPYFRGVAAMEAGDLDKAEKMFRGLLRQAGPGAPWAGDVENRLRQIEMARMTPEQRKEAIVSMVEGLAARLKSDPSDTGGWRRLARAYAALGRKAEAVSALEAALKAANPGERGEIQIDLDALRAQN